MTPEGVNTLSCEPGVVVSIEDVKNNTD
jgi:hypothetical protein